MFKNISDLISYHSPQKNYGVSVVDIDGDGQFEFFVTGFGEANCLLKWNNGTLTTFSHPVLSDPTRFSIGIAAADIDGDGTEEIYLLNADTYGGFKRISDRLFTYRDGAWADLFENWRNQGLENEYSGRSVAAIDRLGSGKYGFIVSNYGGPFKYYEYSEEQKSLVELSSELNINLPAAGRSLVVAPLVSDFGNDIYAGNEAGPNYLFSRQKDATFLEEAASFNLDDPYSDTRGVAVLDANHDGKFDIIIGNWKGFSRLMLNQKDSFVDAAPIEMRNPLNVRNVLVADFDNDGYEEIFFHIMGEENKLFRYYGGRWILADTLDAKEPLGLGTGASYADIDNDGTLELILAHGESGLQPLTLYKAENTNNWLRVFPKTKNGAPARGALVEAHYENGKVAKRVIDGGSGYLCQMEPVAHFGLGKNLVPVFVRVKWNNGDVSVIDQPEINQTHEIRASG